MNIFIYWFLGGLVVIALVALVVWKMLFAVAGRGGERTGDAADIAGGVINQAKAFRGDAPVEGEAWDGVDRQKTGPGVAGAGGV